MTWLGKVRGTSTAQEPIESESAVTEDSLTH
jgi:hypothetical protein